jgi:hypothetical protein
LTPLAGGVGVLILMVLGGTYTYSAKSACFLVTIRCEKSDIYHTKPRTVANQKTSIVMLF